MRTFGSMFSPKMKFSVAVAVVALAAQCLAAPSASNDQYKDLIVDVLTFAKQEMAAHDPYKFPDVKGQQVKTQDLDLTMDQSNTLLSKASTFTVEEVDTDPNTLTATVRVNIPEVLQTFDFNVAGTGFGRQVSGSGSASVSLQGLNQSIVAVFENPDTSLQLKTLTLGYDLSNLVVSENGLQISGMTEAQVQQFFSDKFVEFVKNNKAAVEEATALALQTNINRVIAGQTLAEVAAYVKSLIHQ